MRGASNDTTPTTGAGSSGDATCVNQVPATATENDALKPPMETGAWSTAMDYVANTALSVAMAARLSASAAPSFPAPASLATIPVTETDLGHGQEETGEAAAASSSTAFAAASSSPTSTGPLSAPVEEPGSKDSNDLEPSQQELKSRHGWF